MKRSAVLRYIQLIFTVLAAIILFLCCFNPTFANQDTVAIAFNYPETGPYAKQGIDQWRAAEVARLEINAAGGILGKQVEFRVYDTQSNPKIAVQNANDAINIGHVKMIFGGASSAVAYEVGKVCQEKDVLFFPTLTYATTITGSQGMRHTFRECYHGWPAAKALAAYLNQNYNGKKYFYVTVDYSFGATTESALRKFTHTEDKKIHRTYLSPFGSKEFSKHLQAVERAKPDVLVVILGGQEMANFIRAATDLGLKNKMQIVVPMLTLGMAERGTPDAMAGVIGALPWTWRVPYKYDYERGKTYVEKFFKRFNRYPSNAGASAYTSLHEYKSAVERAGTFETAAVIKALEGHQYQVLKDQQTWRRFDHQSVQTVYIVRCNPASVVLNDKYHLDYFEIIDQITSDGIFRSRDEWNSARQAAGKPTYLEPLPGE
jgi:branched-chain amino acid transport system substrate-binding protein